MIQTHKLYDYGASPLAVIQFLGGIMFPRVYVEFGLSQGTTFMPLVHSFGFENTQMHAVEYQVQPTIRFRHHRELSLPKVHLHEMTTDAFSAGPLKDLELVDLAFIDADHNPLQVMSDFENLYNKLSPHGIILLHDTWPNDKRLLDPQLCDRSFVLPELIKNTFPDAEVFTFRIPLGLTMVQRIPPIDHLKD